MSNNSNDECLDSDTSSDKKECLDGDSADGESVQASCTKDAILSLAAYPKAKATHIRADDPKYPFSTFNHYEIPVPFAVFRTPNGPHRLVTCYKECFGTVVLDADGIVSEPLPKYVLEPSPLAPLEPTTLLGNRDECRSAVVTIDDGTAMVFYKKGCGLCSVQVREAGEPQYPIAIVCEKSRLSDSPDQPFDDNIGIFLVKGHDENTVALFLMTYPPKVLIIDVVTDMIQTRASIKRATGFNNILGPIPWRPGCYAATIDRAPQEIVEIDSRSGNMVFSSYLSLRIHTGICMTSMGWILYCDAENNGHMMARSPLTGQTIRISESSNIIAHPKLVHDSFPSAFKKATMRALTESNSLLPDLVKLVFEFVDHQFAIVQIHGAWDISILTLDLPRFLASSPAVWITDPK